MQITMMTNDVIRRKPPVYVQFEDGSIEKIIDELINDEYVYYITESGTKVWMMWGIDDADGWKVPYAEFYVEPTSHSNAKYILVKEEQND